MFILSGGDDKNDATDDHQHGEWRALQTRYQ